MGYLAIACCLLAVFITVEAQEYCQTCPCPACWIWIGGSRAFAEPFSWTEETPSSTCTQSSCNFWCQDACEDEYPQYNGEVYTSCNTAGVMGDCGYGSCSSGSCNKKRGLLELQDAEFSPAFIIPETEAAVVEKREAMYADPAPGYLGCWADQSTRDLNGSSTSSGIGNYVDCIKFCSGRRYSFAGTQDQTECYCGNEYGRYNSSDACTSTCTNTSGLTDTQAPNEQPNCGGIWANDIWSTGYQGCWTDNSTRDLNGASYSSSSMTVHSCRAYCLSAGYLYGGLQNQNQCYCGNKFNRLGLGQALGECTQTCSGDSNELCGGPWANAVYTSWEQPPSSIAWEAEE